MNKDVKQLVRSIDHIEGLEVRTSGAGHLAVYRNDKYVLTLPATPSDPRWRANALASLRQAGITPATQPAGPARRPVDLLTVGQLRQRIKALPSRAAFARFLTEEMPKLQPGLRTYKTSASAESSFSELLRKTNAGLAEWTHLLLDTGLREWDARQEAEAQSNGQDVVSEKEVPSEAELDKMIAEAKQEEEQQKEEPAEVPLEVSMEEARRTQLQGKLAEATMVELGRDHDDLTARINEMADRVRTLTGQLDELLDRRQAISDEILTRLEKAEARP